MNPSPAGPTWTDTGFVLLSGPAPWWGTEPGSLAERLAGFTMFAWSAVAGVTVLSVGWGQWGPILLVLVGLSVFWLPVVRWSQGRSWTFGRQPLVLIPLRVAAATAAAVGFILSEVPLLLGAMLAGLIGGAEANLSLRGIGVELDVRRALVRFAASPVHVGVGIGLVVGMTLFELPVVDGALLHYGLMWFSVVVLAGSLAGFRGIERVVVAERARLEEHVKAEQHRSRAHWIHDDVCSELRFMRMQLEQRSLDGEQLMHALADLDHRLRLRQLEEQVDSGQARIAEVVQPFVRTLQDRGVDVVDVPPYDVANTALSRATARMLQHALSVLVSNAIQAGASSVSIRCRLGDGRIAVEVEDDAGGFTLHDIPSGRALDGLRHELGDGPGAPALEVEPINGGSLVRVRVPIGASQ